MQVKCGEGNTSPHPGMQIPCGCYPSYKASSFISFWRGTGYHEVWDDIAFLPHQPYSPICSRWRDPLCSRWNVQRSGCLWSPPHQRWRISMCAVLCICPFPQDEFHPITTVCSVPFYPDQDQITSNEVSIGNLVHIPVGNVKERSMIFEPPFSPVTLMYAPLHLTKARFSKLGSMKLAS